jgi:membrane-bound metal-dependent hydrolase YbcI (DUF457 family)
MDPVSHVAFAAALKRGALRLPPEPGTGLAAGLGALSPDIDVLLLPTGWDRYIVAHQAGTHSVVGAIVCGTLAALLAYLIAGRRRQRLRPVLLTGMAAALSHVVADLLSGGTIRLLWPLIDTPIENAGLVALGDPYTVALFAAGGLAMATWPAKRSPCAVALLAVFSLLLAGKAIGRERAVRAASSAVPAGQAYLVEPVWGSLTDWRILEGSADAVRARTVSAFGTVRHDTGVRRVSGDPVPVNASRDWESVRNLIRSHDFTFARGQRAADGSQHVVWSDLRYCPARVVQPDECGVAMSGDFDASGRTLRTTVRIGGFIQER